MKPVIETSALGVRIGSKALLDAVSLKIEPGESVAVVGPNGAGKSTLLRVLSGDIAATDGSAALKGRNPRDYPPRLLALHRAVLSQHTAVSFPFTLEEVVKMGAGERRGAAVDALVEVALAEVELGHLRRRIIGTLSGGEQQRGHLARVLVQLRCGEDKFGPGLLLLDEPAASLDLRHQFDLLAIIARYNARGTTVITIMHDLNLAALFAKRVLALDHGRLAQDGSPSETITDEMLGRVFGVHDASGRIPPEGLPFVLPHRARKSEQRPS